MPVNNNLNYADMSLLYVEDESATREQVARILTAKGYRLLVAENGQAGLQAFREHLPDIVLTDIMMPLMNGLEMSREIRTISPEAQIICLTAFDDTGYLVAAVDIGISRFVFKPIELSRLQASLDHCQEIVELRKRHQKLEVESIRARQMETIAVLAGGMAHDFNNLLQVILGYVSLARMNAVPGSKTEKMLEIAENTSETARELGNRLLTFAKGGDAVMETTGIKPLLMAGVDAELGGSTINCKLDLPDNLPDLRMDLAQISMVISQLIINAREAMPQGGSLRISAATVQISENDSLALEAGEYIHIVFEDSGVGIPSENLPRIFDPYFTTKEIGCQKGMGLGLALSYSVIRRHHGQILAESGPEGGTCMHIYLPVFQAKT